MGNKSKAVNLSYKTFLQSKNGVILQIAEDVGLIFNGVGYSLLNDISMEWRW